MTVSAGALLLLMAGENGAHASSTLLAASDDPPFWFEFGGDFDQIRGRSEIWIPPASTNPDYGTGVQDRKEPLGSFGGEAQLSYRFDEWTMSLSARFGRTHRHKTFHTQTGLINGGIAFFYGSDSRHTESHLFVDFQVGKDVGLGRSGHSIFSGGVRIAQLSANVNDLISSVPIYNTGFRQHFQAHTGNFGRSTSAIGPAVSWNASAALLSSDSSSIALDWGVGGAVLFGKQRVTSHYGSLYRFQNGSNLVEHTSATTLRRNRNVIVPNLNAFAGISYHLPAAKIAIGYRADMFFNGMDGGVATSQRINRSFFGPFINIAFGVGD